MGRCRSSYESTRILAAVDTRSEYKSPVESRSYSFMILDQIYESESETVTTPVESGSDSLLLRDSGSLLHIESDTDISNHQASLELIWNLSRTVPQGHVVSSCIQNQSPTLGQLVWRHLEFGWNG